jgi:hypothetical protein
MSTQHLTSVNADNLVGAAALDAVRIEAERAAQTVSHLTSSVAGIDLNKVGAEDARKIMSAEHKALGYRPPPGSLAAEAQAAAAKHPDAHLDVDAEVLKEAAVEDAAKITSKRRPSLEQAHPAIDLEKIGAAEARTLMSAEHKALGYRPPPGSLAAEAQAAAAKHPNAHLDIDATILREAAREDAARIARERDPEVAPSATANVDLAKIGTHDAALIESTEHKALGYRPPATSFAAKAKAAAAEHPNARAGVSREVLEEAAREDAARVREERGEQAPVEENPAEKEGGEKKVNLEEIGTSDAKIIQSAEHQALGYRPPHDSLAAEAQAAAAEHPFASTKEMTKEELQKAAVEDAERVKGESDNHDDTINLNTITSDEAQMLQSVEQKILGYRPPSDSLAAQAQSVVDKRDNEPVTKEMAAELMSEEMKDRDGQRPPADTIAPVAQSLADKNEADGGNRTLAGV